MLRTALSRQTPIRRFSMSMRTLNSSGQTGPSRSATPTVTHPREPSAESPTKFIVRDLYGVASVGGRIRGWVERTVVALRNRAGDVTTSTQSNLSRLGSQINQVTGYEEIEALKKQVVEQEIRLNSTRQAARDAKEKYADAVIKRASSQREVNDLLQRKSTWTDEDVSRFTTLVRLDHSLEQEEARAKVAMDNSEDAAEKEFNELMRAILTRYHEEQVWSDKIRGASTYGSLAALGLNLFVFVVAIVVVEPWKRKKMSMTFEAKIEAMNAEHKAAMEEAMKAVERKLGEQILILGKGLEGAVAEPMRKREDAGSDGDAATSSSRARSAWDGELGAVVVTSAALAGAIGWLAGTWKTS